MILVWLLLITAGAGILAWIVGRVEREGLPLGGSVRSVP